MKTINNNEFSPFAARTLKLVGVILILSFLLDFVTQLFPFMPLDRVWQISFATQLVEPGAIPLVGLALLFAGYQLDRGTSNSLTNRKTWLDLRFWALLFSCLFGLLFLVICPVHINNINQASTQAISTIDQKAAQDQATLEAQLSSPQAQAQLEQKQAQIKNQIDYLLKNEQQYNQALSSNQIPPELKNILMQSKANPKAVDQIVKQQLNLEKFRTQALAQLQRQQVEAEQKATRDAWQSGLRIGMTSLLLAIAYIAIGIMGLSNIGFLRSRQRPSAR